MEEIYPGNESPVRLAFRSGYLGERFWGSQMQKGARTVEGDFVSSCIRMNLFSSHREGRFQAAGRTDRGVHARAQVFSFSTLHPERAFSALNRQLPPDIWVHGYAQVDPDFNPRRHAISRTYRYYFGTPGLDVQAMDSAARAFEGTHDFSLFARVGDKDPARRVMSSRVFSSGDLAVFEISAESFLWHMVRYMASALHLIGSGEEGERLIRSRLAGERSSRISIAPPDGLILWDIEYDLHFRAIPADSRTRDFLERRYAYCRGMTGILETLRDTRKTGTGDFALSGEDNP